MDFLPRLQCAPSSWCRQYHIFFPLLHRQPAAFRISRLGRVSPEIQSQEPHSSTTRHAQRPPDRRKCRPNGQSLPIYCIGRTGQPAAPQGHIQHDIQAPQDRAAHHSTGRQGADQYNFFCQVRLTSGQNFATIHFRRKSSGFGGVFHGWQRK